MGGEKFVFIISHLGSGSHLLSQELERHPGFTKSYTRTDYSSELAFLPYQHTDGMIFDHLLFDYNFYLKKAYQSCKFIYVIADPRSSATRIQPKKIKDWSLYYCFRLRRICEMAKNTPGAFLVNGNKLIAGQPLPGLANFLGVPAIKTKPVLEPSEFLSDISFNWAEKCYEKSVYYLGKFLPGFQV